MLVPLLLVLAPLGAWMNVAALVCIAHVVKRKYFRTDAHARDKHDVGSNQIKQPETVLWKRDSLSTPPNRDRVHDISVAEDKQRGSHFANTEILWTKDQ